MPIYEYQCNNCQHEFEEILMGSSKEEDIRCPKCSSEDVKKKTSGFSAGTGKATKPASAMPQMPHSCGGG